MPQAARASGVIDALPQIHRRDPADRNGGQLMHQKDFDLLSGALALEHHDAVAHGPKRAVAQAEHMTLTITEAIAREHHTFDPVKFMLAACEAAEIGQLTPPVRQQFVARFGVTEPRPRLRTEEPGLYPDEIIDTSRWTERSAIGGALFDVSRSHGSAWRSAR